ncbi:MAG TPA: acylneuraminate cytidylyltransferase family protein [Gemmatimonadaceae bacterium]|nr:acylneuraminate cytidylyltransferase family protein [Gemmatimonadaceae bacterium]
MGDYKRDENGRVLAVIPARGGSKGVQRKNVRELAGKPLIAYSIECAQATACIDDVVVSTDDDEIAEVSRCYGARVVLRPRALAQDNTPTLPVLLHVLDEMADEEQPSRVVTVQPTSPLRGTRDLSDAIALLTPEYDSVIGVCEPEHTPYKMFQIANDSLSPIFPGVPRGTPRQQLPTVYRENGAVYVTWNEVLRAQESIWGVRARPYCMSVEASVDIDSLHDFALAEYFLKQRALSAIHT